MVGVISPVHSPSRNPNRGSVSVIAVYDNIASLLRELCGIDSDFMCLVIAIALTCAFFVSSAKAVRELVVIEEPQLAQRVEGIVLDPSGAPISDMIVTDRTENGVAVLRTTDGY
jgi:hypothetical protein